MGQISALLKSDYFRIEILKTIPLMEIERSSCECGCKDIAVDHFHGERFCPECGLVHDHNFIDLTAKMNSSF